jgi:3',5'-cyclic AMP phosphodiesterase CpdA
MLIAQLSDVHVGGGRYREELLRAAIEEINTAAPDLVVVAGDVTDEGYPDQYPIAKQELSALACPLIVRVPGNHDARNVEYLNTRADDVITTSQSRSSRTMRHPTVEHSSSSAANATPRRSTS